MLVVRLFHYRCQGVPRIARFPLGKAIPRPCSLQQPFSMRMKSSPSNNGTTLSTVDKCFPVVVTLGMGGILLGVAKLSKTAVFEPREHDTVWFGERGVFSSQRAFAVLPLLACAGSGIAAAGIAKFYPLLAAKVELPSKLHEMLAFPLAILVAFRFDKSYERWWFARSEVESIFSGILSLAVTAKSSTPDGKQEQVKRNTELFFSRLLALCDCVANRLQVGDARAMKTPSSLNPEDAANCAAAPDSVFWCMNAVASCIAEGQSLGQFSGEISSQMYSTLDALQSNFRTCQMIESQKSPAPFVVHMRSLLLLWCFTFPFTVIREMSAVQMLPTQLFLSFALMGIEFCSREMEQPFGDDDIDIHVSDLMEEVIARVQDVGRAEARRLEGRMDANASSNTASRRQ
eukprot:TRINITY_DN95322_c0_g1_i1.p1 TRINITY_DN95322_c0_g1~~TRINITY_DN95322_c0_g1_i1.p1  ORF type:complete len:402 (-),score=48.03 TRINITY_DN95322_c0_g1_i1:60-1265(-)